MAEKVPAVTDTPDNGWPPLVAVTCIASVIGCAGCGCGATAGVGEVGDDLPQPTHTASATVSSRTFMGYAAYRPTSTGALSGQRDQRGEADRAARVDVGIDVAYGTRIGDRRGRALARRGLPVAGSATRRHHVRGVVGVEEPEGVAELVPDDTRANARRAAAAAGGRCRDKQIDDTAALRHIGQSAHPVGAGLA